MKGFAPPAKPAPGIKLNYSRLPHRYQNVVRGAALAFSVVAIATPALAASIPVPTQLHAAAATRADAGTRATARARYAELPIAFEANKGQTDAAVRYFSRAPGYSLFLTQAEAVLSLPRANDAAPAVIRIGFDGANTATRLTGIAPEAGHSNYFIGSTALRDVTRYAKVRYDDLYPGVDLVYYGTDGQLEYDFVVSPGSDASRIALNFGGVQKMHVDTQGNLVLRTTAGDVVQHAPIAYQQVNGERRVVAAQYAVLGARKVGFKIGAHDATQPLVIDPVLVYSTYHGGTLGDQGNDVTVDASSNAYVTGRVNSAIGFPVLGAYQAKNNGASDIFVSKFSPTGALVYSTYLGGIGTDEGAGIAVDSVGNAYVTGRTTSIDFPLVNAFQSSLGGTQDAFLVKLNASGNGLVFSTYLGGNTNPGGTSLTGEYGHGVAVDANNSAYVTGLAVSTNFPVVNAYQSTGGGAYDDVFVTKFSPAGNTLVYSTYLGGSQFDEGYSIAVDSTGAAYVAGITASSNFPLVNPRQSLYGGNNDGFLAKLSPAGNTLVYSTYVGGFGQDAAYGVAVDANGSAFVTGVTGSANFPTVNSLQAYNGGVSSATPDAFVCQYTPAGNAQVYSTFLGGSSNETGIGVAIDGNGNAYVVGQTTSTDFPTVSPIQASNASTSGLADVFVSKISAGGTALLYSTYLGGSGEDTGNDIAVNAAGDAFITGQTSSTNFPTASARQATNGGSSDAFVARISTSSDITLSISDVRVTEGNSGTTDTTFTVSLSKAASQAVSFNFATADGTATAGSDYIASSLTGVSIPAGSLSKTITVLVNGDTVGEPDEVFYGNISKAVGATIADAQGVATIVNDDVITAPALSIDDVSVVEGNSGTSLATFTVSLSQPSSVAVGFNIATADGTATAGSDYVALALTGQTIAAGQTSKTFTVTINGDTIVEPNETFTINLSSATGGAVIAKGQGIGTILNDDSAVVPSLSVADVSIIEGNSGSSLATFTVTLSQATSVDVTFNVFTSNNTAAAGSDYVALSLSGQSIAAGQTSKTFAVTINGDTTVEADESYFFNVSSVANATVARGQAIGTIVNDDSAVLPTLSINDVTVTEGNSGTSLATFTVSLSSLSASAVSFDIATANGTAAAGSDFVAIALTGQSIPAGQASKSFNITINGDTTVEPDETFSVNLSNPVNATISKAQGIGTILNDDVAPVPTLSINDVTVTEGNSGTSLATFTVSLSAPSSNTVSFNVATANGTAAAGSDYVALPLSGQSMAPGTTSKSFSVTINGDTAVEPDETFTLNLSSPVNATISKSAGLGTILNDDNPQSNNPGISVNDASDVEGNSGNKSISFTVSLSVPNSVPTTFTVSTADGTAFAGSDYVANTANMSIPAGQTSANFTVSLIPDTLVEPNETFTVNLSNVVSAVIANEQGLGTIINDDNATISVANVSMPEGNSGATTATFQVSLSLPMPTPVTLTIATGNGSGASAATAGVDYVARGATTLVIDAGRTHANFDVRINGDTTVEADETFNVLVTGISGASNTTASAVGTIVNDDVAALTIGAVQGSGQMSSLLGKDAQVSGVVTAVTGNGFFMQSAAGNTDGSADTSDGIFVASGSSVSVGDLVKVSGRVDESSEGTDADQLTLTSIAATSAQVLSSGNALPTPVTLDASNLGAGQSVTALERFEGMRVAMTQLSVVAPVGGSIDETRGSARSNGRFYGVAAGVARPFREPGLSALARASRTNASPSVFDSNPERLMIDSLGQVGAKALSADTGDSVRGLVGVLGYGAGAYQLKPDPTAAISVTSGATPKAVSTRAAGQATIGSFDLRRLLDDRRNGSEPVMQASAYATRLAKAANAICAYAKTPDVLGLAGVENKAALADLASALNSNDGNLLFPGSCGANAGYKGYMLPGSGTRNVGFLVSTSEVRPGVARVEVLSVTQLGASATFRNRNGSTEALSERPALLMVAKINGADGSSDTVSVVANHLAAIEGDLAAPGSKGWATQGDYLRAKQAAQAGYLAGWIQARQSANPAEKLVVLGDFNANEFNDGHADVLGLVTGRPTARNHVLSYLASPVATPLTNLTTRLPKAERYTVTRDGNAQAVDHILVNSALLQSSPQAHVEVARINADFGEDYLGDAGVPMRVSDHDPVVLYFDLH